MSNPISIVSKREEQIMRFGCPECGSSLDIIISDKEGVLFQCTNKKCSSGRPRIPYKKADRMCPKKEAAIEKVVLRRETSKVLETLDRTIRQLEEVIRQKKSQSGELQRHMLKCKDAYREVRDLRLFDKKGNRIYTVANPFVCIVPEMGKVCIIGNIKQKRRAHTMLLSHWWYAKERYNQCIAELMQNKQKLKEARERRLEARAKLDKLEASLKKSND